MKSSPYELDPGGDIELVLENQELEFAWSNDSLECIFFTADRPRESCPPAESDYPTPADDYIPEKEDYAEEPADEQVEETPAPENNFDEAEPAPPDEELLDDEKPTNEDNPVLGHVQTNEPPKMVRLRVSSRHLILASPVFRKMLEGPWRESQACHGPLREISVGEWDLEAFIIVLDIIHGHHRLVPRSLSLEMLAKVAVIVNYYDCVEVVEVFSDNWLQGLEKDLPKSYGRESILALLASWVFSAVGIFEKMTELAVRNSNCLIQAADLPIPGEILDSIDQSRQISVGRIFSGLYTLLDSLTREEVGCSLECSSMILGSLTIQLNKHEILSPRATAPFSGYNVTAVQAIVYKIRRTTWYTQSSRSSYHSLSVHSCNLPKHMEPTMDTVEGELKGLKLEDYQHSK